MKIYHLLTFAITALCLAVTPSAFGQNINRLTARDVRFLRAAAQGLIFEVRAGELADTRANDPAVKAVAERIVTDHTADLEALRDLAARKGVTLPTEPNARHQRELTRLARLSGFAFDRAYVRFEIADHRTDIRAYVNEVILGGDFDVRGFAASRLPVLLTHLQLLYAAAFQIGVLGSANLALQATPAS